MRLTHRRLAIGLAGAALASALVAASAAEARPRHFTFSWAGHVPDAMAMTAAQAFVKDDLAAGLSMAEAEDRVTRAGARCRPGARAGSGADEPVICRYLIEAATDNGGLGQDVWLVRLTPDPSGALATAEIERKHYGSRGDLPKAPEFEF